MVAPCKDGSGLGVMACALAIPNSAPAQEAIQRDAIDARPE
jgi:hypothetical protein